MNRFAAYCLLLLLTPFCARAQSWGGNGIKLNLPSLFVKNISLQYERALGKHTSLCLGLRIEPSGSVPQKGIVEGYLDANDSIARRFINEARVSNWAITPEFRYYLGKKPQNGFYLAPYLRFGGYSGSWNYVFTDDDGKVYDVGFKGHASVYSGGLMIGAQWHIARHFLIDWWIAGVSEGSVPVRLDVTTDLSGISDKDRQQVTDIINSAVIDGHHVTGTINNNGGYVSGTFGIPGLRAGLCFGVVF